MKHVRTGERENSVTSCREMVRLDADLEWVHEGMRDLPDCCRERDRGEGKHSRGQGGTSRLLSPLIRCDMGEAEKKKVRLGEINKKRERDCSDWVKVHKKQKTRGHNKNQLSFKCVTAGCLRC